MKRILLPTDLSDHSKNAIRYALQMFKEATDHHFVLMNAYHMPYAGAVMMTSIEDVMQKSATEDMEALVLELGKSFPDMVDRITSEVIHGDPYVVMQNKVSHNEIDLVVMGTTGASGLKAALVGSVTAQVVKNLNCAVLAVPANAQFSPPKNIAFAADNIEVLETALEPLLNIVKQHNSKVLIFSVKTVDEEVNIDDDKAAIGLHDLFEGVEHEFLPSTHHDLEVGILNFVSEKDCDMLVMVHHDHSIIHQLFHKSASKQLALHAQVPLLVLQDNSNN